ncbi:MAG: ABC transporter permease subunit [Thermodesulfobacteriota bacterium]|nr:ABC transporter permease subunit [Thermodesulfobacteriota bacterium]
MERTIERLLFFAAITSAGLTLLIFIFMVILGLPLIGEGRFFSLLTTPWSPSHDLFGIYPMIIGTLSIAFLAMRFSVPLSMGCSVLVTLYADSTLSRFLSGLIRLMTGIPTVIYGFTGIFLIVPFIRQIFQNGSGMCILSASLLLAVLIAPTMILFFTDSFNRVPAAYTLAVDALGGTRAQKLFYVILPHSIRGILSGMVLALGRAMGDTLIALMIAGNAVAVPTSVLDSARTLTAHIALVIAADFDSIEFRTLFACGIVLYGFTTLLILIIRGLSTEKEEVP